MITRWHFITVGLLGALAVSLGALGAHWLKSKLGNGITIDQLNGFDTGVKYHMYHTLAMFMLLLWMAQNSSNANLKWSYRCFLIGILLFSGSLYFLCTRGLTQMEFLRFLGPVTPVGGLFFVAGWILLAFGVKNKIKV